MQERTDIRVCIRGVLMER